MNDYSCFNYEYLFGDYMNVSAEAKMYFIELMFHCKYGFVANPIQILESRNLKRSVFDELVAKKHILTKEGRTEVILSAYFVHNMGFDTKKIYRSTFWYYWKHDIIIKDNRIIDFKKQQEVQTPKHQEPVENKYTDNPDDEMFQPNSSNDTYGDYLKELNLEDEDKQDEVDDLPF